MESEAEAPTSVSFHRHRPCHRQRYLSHLVYGMRSQKPGDCYFDLGSTFQIEVIKRMIPLLS